MITNYFSPRIQYLIKFTRSIKILSFIILLHLWSNHLHIHPPFLHEPILQVTNPITSWQLLQMLLVHPIHIYNQPAPPCLNQHFLMVKCHRYVRIWIDYILLRCFSIFRAFSWWARSFIDFRSDLFESLGLGVLISRVVFVERLFFYYEFLWH